MEFEAELKKTFFVKLLVILLVLLSLDLGVGAWFFRAQQQQQQHLIEDQLTAIGSLKVRQIADWRQRMLDEATLLAESPFFARGVQMYLEDSHLENARALLQRMRSLATHYHCPGVLLITPQGKTMVSYGPFSQLGEKNPLEDLVTRAMGKRQTVLSDLYADDRGGAIYLAVAAPLFKNGQPAAELLGAVVLVYDPKRFLFPLINNWPIPSDTAESLLIRGDGDDVLFLNELRHRQGSSLNLRIPKSKVQIPAAAALAGTTGIMQGVDYRGEKVIAHVQPVPDSPWFIVTKIDEYEAFTIWRSQSLLLLLAFSGITGLLLAIGLAILQRNREKHFHQLFAAEQQLRQNAERSGVILLGIADGIIVTDHFGRIELLNPEAEGLTGWRNGEARGMPLTEVFTIINPKDGEKEEDSVSIVLRDGKKVVRDNRPLLLRKDGRKVPISESGAPLHDSQGHITGAVLVFRDQSKAHLLECADQKLRESLQTSDDLVRAIPSGLFIYQHHPPDGLILLSSNPEAARLTGKNIDHLIGLDFDTIWPEAKTQGITDRFLGVMQTGKMYETEDLHYADDQLVGAFRIRAFVLPGSRLAVAFENITGLKQSEAKAEKIQAQLQQAQKMESVGRLAGGVAHDFNNMLSVILGNAELALEQSKKDTVIQRELGEIKTAALRSADLTKQLLAFARKQAVAPKAINLNHAIEGMLKMLRRLIGEDIQLAWLPQTDLTSIFIDPSQVDQILANLCVNARDAIDGQGKIIIETGATSLSREYCGDNPGFVPGDFITLSFSDNGTGIPKEHLNQIFEPFFTTKRQGEGTGLGLAMIYGIVKQNGGFIKVYSEPDQGTAFRIYLPQYCGETVEVRRIDDLDMPQGQGELVLLVEDETVLLDLNVRMLERLGYRVLATSSASEAILLAKEHKAQLRLLLTDIVMPEMNGHDLAKTICLTNPELKCLFMSGYTANVIARQGFLPEGMNFLQKPFMKRDLALKLHQILAEQPAIG
ncbi:MAG: ATP-binding protein [Pseudomonadota bacterium]